MYSSDVNDQVILNCLQPHLCNITPTNTLWKDVLDVIEGVGLWGCARYLEDLISGETLRFVVVWLSCLFYALLMCWLVYMLVLLLF